MRAQGRARWTAALLATCALMALSAGEARALVGVNADPDTRFVVNVGLTVVDPDPSRGNW